MFYDCTGQEVKIKITEPSSPNETQTHVVVIVL